MLPARHPNQPMAMTHVYTRLICALMTATALFIATGAQAQVPSAKTTVAATTSPMVRNGDGVRSQGATDLYRAALYLSQPANSLDQLLQAQGGKRLELQMLREMSSDELGKLFARGMEKSGNRQEFSRTIPGLIRMSEIFSQHKRLAAGDVLAIEWIPGKGTVISVKGQAQGAPIADPVFFETLLGIWLGSAPVDARLKASLLAGTPA